MAKCHETNADIYMCVCLSLLQLRSRQISSMLPSPATFLPNTLGRGIMSRFSRLTIVCNNDECNHSAIINRHPQVSRNLDTHKIVSFLPTSSSVSGQQEDRVLWMQETIVRHGTGDNREEAAK